MQISPECLERRRLIRKVEEAVAAVYEFKDQLRNGWKNDTAVSILLDQARTAERHAQRALHDHIEEHGCVTPKLAPGQNGDMSVRQWYTGT